MTAAQRADLCNECVMLLASEPDRSDPECTGEAILNVRLQAAKALFIIMDINETQCNSAAN